MRRVLPLLLLLLMAMSAGFVLNACFGEDQTRDDLAEAREYMRHRDFMEAEKFFERYLRRNPDGPHRWEAWNNLVDLALNVRHNRNSAVELLEAMTIEYENSPQERRMVQERLAEEYENMRRYERAMELWSALEKDKDTPALKKAEIYRNMARVYLRRLEFELARESLTLCMELDIAQSAKSECRYDLADAYMVMEYLDSGIAELRTLLQQDGVDDELRVLSIFMLADALEQQGNRAAALTLFESIRHSYPNLSVVEARIEYLKTRPKP